MNINELKKIIINQKEDLDSTLNNKGLIERDINFTKIKKNLSHPNVVVIKGVRRCGKSTLASTLLKNEKVGFINFDDNALAGFKVDDFELLLQAFYEIWGNNLEYFIFDEIQNIKGWELFISKLRRTKKIIITGSNAHLLSSELATHLTGRYSSYTLFPFSFKEYLKYKNFEFKKNHIYSTKKIAEINVHLEKYLKTGGFPESYKLDEDMALRIYNDIIEKDILIRHNIKHVSALKELGNYMVSHFSHEFTYSKLRHQFSIKDVHTIRNYLQYIEDTYLVFKLNRFSYKLKQQHITPKKSYIIDTGLIEKVAFQCLPNKGALIENLVFLELLRKKHYENDNIEIYYWQDALNKEIDFVLKRGRKIEKLIQVSYVLDNYKTKEREFKSLLSASKNLRCDNLLLITLNEEAEEKINNKTIKIIPLFKWILEN